MTTLAVDVLAQMSRVARSIGASSSSHNSLRQRPLKVTVAYNECMTEKITSSYAATRCN